jgi:mono/diheme cytochrome c family protein
MKALNLSAAIVCAVATLAGCAHKPETPSLAGSSGEHLFQTLCSNCHGLDGMGNGPVSPYISGQPPDLTHITARSGGKFPAERVFQVIDGQFDSPAPNARHMPIWGYDLFDGGGDDETAHQQVLDVEHSLVRYIESIQEPAGGGHPTTTAQ